MVEWDTRHKFVYRAVRGLPEKRRWAQYQRIVAQRGGENRGIIAAAHSTPAAIWHILKYNVPYRNLGSNFYDGFHREYKIKAYLKQLQALGWEPEASAVSV